MTLCWRSCLQAALLTTALGLAAAGPATAAEKLEVVVRESDQTLENVPIKVNVHLPEDRAELKVVRLEDEAGREILGQLARPGLLSEAKDEPGRLARELHLVLPKVKKGETVKLSGALEEADADAPQFRWEDAPGKYATLHLGDRPVLRYMYEAVDDSSEKRRMETYKVYHHVFDPQGERLVTKGPGGLFPHHRGLFYGFNKITYGDGKQADVWHCRRGESQTHEELLSQEEGPVLGRHRAKIAWRGVEGEPFAMEEREMAVYNTPEGTLIEFASRLKSADGTVKLDGDPQHAGFQFRASQHVPDHTRRLTYYVRPDGKGKPGEFRNWPQNAEHVNLPFHALSFVIDDQRYTCVYVDHPQNPKEARFSERDYGRFGSYFEAEISGDETLDVNYRVWLQEGEMSVDEAARQSAQFVDPPQAEARAG